MRPVSHKELYAASENNQHTQPQDMQGSANSNTAAEEQLWEAVKALQTKHQKRLWMYMPTILRSKHSQSLEGRETFMKHFQDTCNVLNLRRPCHIPDRLTMAVLQKMDIFLELLLSKCAAVMNDTESSSSTTMCSPDENKDD